MARKLFLIDGSNQAFRAFFAIRTDMRGADGFPTRALFGFASMLQKLLRDHQPDFCAVVFDEGLSFRNELYPDYKGQRPDMPDDLRTQWPEFRPFSEAMGVTALAKRGYEADDIIGTLAVAHATDELKVWIVSSDKDFGQLVNENIHLFDAANDADLGATEIEDKWGVRPDQVIDLLALMGDTSDNVPGVPGVGPKKAAQFLKKYGDLDSVLAHAAEIGGKTGQSVADSVEVVALARQLVTIHCDVALGLGLADLALRTPDYPALEQLLMRYQFRRMLAEVQAELGEDSARESEVSREQYQTVDTVAGVKALAADLRKAGRFAFDSETTSLDPMRAKIVGMSFCWDPAFAVYVPIGHTNGTNVPEAPEILAPLLADPSVKKTGQNLKYDLQVLLSNGLDLRGIDGDTMLADYLLDVDRRHNLDDLAERHLGHKMISYGETTRDTGGDFAAVPVAEAARYAAEDAHVAFLLDQKLELGPLAGVYREAELPLVPVLARMELAGIGVDVEALGLLSVELGERIAVMQTEIVAEAGQEFNLNSTKQLGVILFEKRGLKPIKKTKTGPSTDAATLEALALQGDRLCGLILEYRELHKLKSTYVDTLPSAVGVDGRIHTSFHQAVAATGRLSSNDPNLQNIPIRTAEGRRIRECFVARPGHRFLSADYSQIELRVLAHFCKEGPLVEAFRAGEDIHRRTAAEIFGVSPSLVSGEQRRAAKAINFGIVYGMSAFRLANELKIPRREAQAYIDGYFARSPQVRTFMEEAVSSAKEKGYAETILGRRRTVHQLDSKNPIERGAAERIAINTPVQGSAADLIKLAMIKVDARLRRELPGAHLLLQVHDELVLEVPEEILEAARTAVIEEMSGVWSLAVPLLVDTGDGLTWNAAH